MIYYNIYIYLTNQIKKVCLGIFLEFACFKRRFTALRNFLESLGSCIYLFFEINHHNSNPMEGQKLSTNYNNMVLAQLAIGFLQPYFNGSLPHDVQVNDLAQHPLCPEEIRKRGGWYTATLQREIL